MRPFSMSPLRPSPPLPAGRSSLKWLGGGRDEERNGSVGRFGGGDLGLGEREESRGGGGGERARVVSGAVSW